MAFSVRLLGYPTSPSGPTLKMEPPWWPAGELRWDPRFKGSATDGYLDYVAELSVEAARELHERFKPRACLGVFGCADWQRQLGPMLGELDAAFGPRAAEFARFRIEVFEWESGLG